jgi:hypothetical protein
MRWAADLANLIFRLSGRGHYGASVISPALIISAWGRRLKTTNAHSAQLAALRHKRALILWLDEAFARRGLMNPLIFAGTHIGQTSWTNDVDREFHPSEA